MTAFCLAHRSVSRTVLLHIEANWSRRRIGIRIWSGPRKRPTESNVEFVAVPIGTQCQNKASRIIIEIGAPKSQRRISRPILFLQTIDDYCGLNVLECEQHQGTFVFLPCQIPVSAPGNGGCCGRKCQSVPLAGSPAPEINACLGEPKRQRFPERAPQKRPVRFVSKPCRLTSSYRRRE